MSVMSSLSLRTAGQSSFCGEFRGSAVTLVTSLGDGVSGMSVDGFRWYLRGRTCSPFRPSSRSIAGVLMGGQNLVNTPMVMKDPNTH